MKTKMVVVIIATHTVSDTRDRMTVEYGKTSITIVFIFRIK
jgi:hypothetical protein